VIFEPEVSNTIRVLCVDDHQIVRKGVAAILAEEPDLILAGEAETAAQALAAYRALRPDVTLMDLRLPDATGIEAAASIREEFADARIIVLTSYEGDQDVYRALGAGVRGYLLKETVHGELIEAIRTVHAGKKFVPAGVARNLCEYFPDLALTRRETEILEYVASGLGNKEIGKRLGTAAGTVKAQVQSILSKLGARDRTHAVTIGLRRGIIHFFLRGDCAKS
jgi:DNA-binding NarL/FixJ family response regulator